jgi:penicillin-binding protein 1B
MVRILAHPFGKFLAATCAFVLVAGLGTFTFFFLKYSKLIDEKLSAGPFPNTSMLFAAPRQVVVGDETTPDEIVSILRRSGYSETTTNRMGWYKVRPDAVEIFPGVDSYFRQDAGVIKFEGQKVSKIIFVPDSTERTVYQLEPELMTNLFDRKREKRRLVKFPDIPKVLVHAIVSIEDKRFFQHAGFDPLRIVKAAYVDVSKGYMAQGSSTLTMQLARNFWLTPDKNWQRKAAETIITLELEQKLSKEEIFEYYANQVDLGRRGSFSIRGVGEASQAYFGKDLRALTLPEAATIAGLIQRPSATNPLRWPERAKARRNVVLSMMRENGYIGDKQYADAFAAPLNVVRGGADSTDAPYFVDLVNDGLLEDFQDYDFQNTSYRVYTTLDMNLQREAAEAVRIGMQEVDALLKRRKSKNEAQVALVALDPQTGEIKALIGGRNYGMSQLNRALAKRQPGSSFKPFVYAAAMNTALQEGAKQFTPASTILDEPTTFWFDSKPYEPNNHNRDYFGTVTVRQALAKSLNIPAVKLAEAVGYDKVVEIARQAGMNLQIQPTPAIALGAYEVTPIEVAGGYTIFANRGVFVKPNWISMIRDDTGHAIFENKPVKRQVLDPRVAYLMVSLMEEVLRSGTGAGTRARGFGLPAAGKTGTSHDGWFAGFTSKLICVVWVGFDDNKELHLEGAQSALPVWTEFMKRAHQYREYRGAHAFSAPDGIVSVMIDPLSGQLAAPDCPTQRAEVFITGSQPIESCRLHSGNGSRSTTQVAGWDNPPAEPDQSQSTTDRPRSRNTRRESKARQEQSGQAPGEAPPEARKGLFGRIKDIFK